MRFRYRQLPAAGQSVDPEPLVWISLAGPRGKIRMWAVIDSGSPETMVPAAALSRIGVPLSDEEKSLGGIGGGSVPCRISTMRSDQHS